MTLKHAFAALLTYSLVNTTALPALAQETPQPEIPFAFLFDGEKIKQMNRLDRKMYCDFLSAAVPAIESEPRLNTREKQMFAEKAREATSLADCDKFPSPQFTEDELRKIEDCAKKSEKGISAINRHMNLKECEVKHSPALRATLQ